MTAQEPADDARELLAAEYRRDGMEASAIAVLAGMGGFDCALRAITEALKRSPAESGGAQATAVGEAFEQAARIADRIAGDEAHVADKAVTMSRQRDVALSGKRVAENIAAAIRAASPHGGGR